MTLKITILPIVSLCKSQLFFSPWVAEVRIKTFGLWVDASFLGAFGRWRGVCIGCVNIERVRWDLRDGEVVWGHGGVLGGVGDVCFVKGAMLTKWGSSCSS